jgi:hypothetical protein
MKRLPTYAARGWERYTSIRYYNFLASPPVYRSHSLAVMCWHSWSPACHTERQAVATLSSAADTVGSVYECFRHSASIFNDWCAQNAQQLQPCYMVVCLKESACVRVGTRQCFFDRSCVRAAQLWQTTCKCDVSHVACHMYASASPCRPRSLMIRLTSVGKVDVGSWEVTMAFGRTNMTYPFIHMWLVTNKSSCTLSSRTTPLSHGAAGLQLSLHRSTYSAVTVVDCTAHRQ